MTLFLAASLIGAAPVAEHVPPARDGNIPIREELCAARAKGTLDAYDLFIARHPKHALAEQAEKERREIAAGRRPKPAGPDCPPGK